MRTSNSRSYSTIVQSADAERLALAAFRAERPDPEAVEQATLQYRAEDSEAAMAGAVAGGGTLGTMIPWVLDPAQTVDFYLSSPWLGAIGNLLSDAIQSAAPELRPRKYTPSGEVLDGDADPKEQAAALAWLHREDFARDGVSALDFRGFAKAATSAFDETGNLFVEVGRNDDGDAPDRLALLLPQFVYYEIHAERGTRLLQIDPYTGKDFRFLPFGTRAGGQARNEDGKPAREFLHERRSNRISSVYGIPPWIEARTSIQVDNAHREYLSGFFSNHSAPRYLVEVTDNPEWTGEVATREELDSVFSAVQDFLAANRGDMSGRNLLSSHPGSILIRIHPLDVKVEDPTFGKAAVNMRDEIMAVRHIALISLGLPEGGYRATAETQEETFRRTVLYPFAAPVLRMVNRILHAPAPHGLGIETWDLTLDFRSIQETIDQLEAIAKILGHSPLTTDEGRDILDYEALGIDRIYAPAGLAPLEEQSFGEEVEGGVPPVPPARPGRNGGTGDVNIDLDEDPEELGEVSGG